jgi:hypothetical protein
MRYLLLFAALVTVVLLGLGIYLVQSPEKVDEIRASMPFLSAAKEGATSLPGSVAANVPAIAQEPRPELMRFLDSEAKTFNSTKLDAEAVERRVQAEADQLTAADLQFLATKAQGLNSRASDRILSAYLLISSKEKGWGPLRDLVLAPLQGKPDAPPHTVDEAQAMQEKTIRIMAIEGLFEQALKNRQAREEFLRILSELRDPTLVNYAQKRAKELPPL